MEPEARFEARAKEPVARALIRKLIVPRIYFSAAWPDGDHDVDVVAINRAGAGDVHVVEVKRKLSTGTLTAVRRLMAVPAHYRWIAFERSARGGSRLPQLPEPKTGAGRIGLIEIVTMADGSLGANVVREAERFHDDLVDPASDFVKRTRPDIKYS